MNKIGKRLLSLAIVLVMVLSMVPAAPHSHVHAASVEEGHVAAIGDTGYTTIDAALAAAVDGDTVTLLQDVTMSTNYAGVKGASITIDTAGHTLSTGTSGKFTTSATDFNLTFTGGGTVDYTKASNTQQLNYLQSGSTITFRDVTVEFEAKSASTVTQGAKDVTARVCFDNAKVNVTCNVTTSNGFFQYLTVEIKNGTTFNFNGPNDPEVPDAYANFLKTGTLYMDASTLNISYSNLTIYDAHVYVRNGSTITATNPVGNKRLTQNSGTAETVYVDGTSKIDASGYIMRHCVIKGTGAVVTADTTSYSTAAAVVEAFDENGAFETVYTAVPAETAGYSYVIVGGTWDALPTYANWTAKGGTFKVEVPEAKVAEGYDAKNANGVWTVGLHTHTFTETITKPATCVEDGVKTYTCKCGKDTYTVVIPATGHSYETKVTAPTCTEKGYTTYTCACGDTYTADEVAATGHKYDAVVTAPTCTEKGYTTYTCACGDTYTADEVMATGHSYTAVVTPPALNKQGYTTYTCACGHSYVADYTPALKGEASIGNTGYATLEEAIADAEAGDVIVLNTNATVESKLEITKNLTINGNGNTITSTAARGINIETTGKVEINDLTITCSGQRAINVLKAAELTLNNVDATATTYALAFALESAGSKTVVNDSTLTALAVVNVAVANVEVEINNTEIINVDNSAAENYGAINIGRNATGSKVVVNGGKVTVSDDSYGASVFGIGGDVTFNGTEGTTNVEYIVAVDNNGYGYTTLEEALEEVEAGGTIEMIRDYAATEIITVDKAVTINGNGNTITSTATRAFNIDTTGKVVFNDLTVNAGERAFNIINKASTVELNDVTATAKNNAVMIATSAGAAKVTINDSDLTGLAVVNVAGAGADVAINNTIITNVDANPNEDYGAITVWSSAENATVKVNGGDIIVADDSKECWVFPANATVEGVEDVGLIVFTVGDAGFDTLEEALEEVEAGGTIEMVRDYVATEIIIVDKAVTINGNGNTITSTATRGINIETTGKVEINDLTITCSGQRAINVLEAAELTLNNVDATATTYALAFALESAGSKTVVNDSTLTALAVVNVAVANVEVEINNTEIINVDNSAAENYGAINIGRNATGSKVVVNGGKVTVSDDSYGASVFGIGGDVTFNGTEGTTNVEYIVAVDNNGYGYTTLEEAAQETKAGETIKMIRDYAASSVVMLKDGVTLDLNGCTATGTILGKIAVNGGDIITADDYHIVGGEDAAYLTENATFIVAADGITVVSGDVVLGWSMNTDPNHTLVVESGATFTIPAGKTLIVNGKLYVNGVVANNGTLKITGYVKGDIAGTIQMAGGTFETSQYVMAGVSADAIYYTEDATFTIAADGSYDTTIVSGTMKLQKDYWWTLPGQTLTVNAGATFEIPAGKTLEVNNSNVVINGTAINNGTLKIANGAWVKGDIAGTIQMAGGTFETSEYVMIGANEGMYTSTDANFTIAADGTYDMTVNSGTITLNAADWWTLEGQALIIAEDAKFIVPAGKNINVQDEVIVNGTVEVEGTVTLYNENASVAYADDSLIENFVANVGDCVWYTEGKYVVHTHTVVEDEAVAPTCTETGLTAGSHCSVCNEILVAQEEVAALGHNYVGTQTKAPACGVAGEMTYVCENDASHTYTEAIPALEHVAGAEVEVERVEATATEDGYVKYAVKCELCNETLSERTEVLPATGVVVAVIGNAEYLSVQAALDDANSGETVQVVAPAEEAYIMVPAGVTLDLKGQTLTVGSAASFGIIMDSGNASAIGTGKLIVGEYDLAMSSNGVYAPVWDGTGYVFVAVEFRQQITTSNGYKVRFYNNNAVSRSYISQIMADGDVNNVISLVVRGSWTGNADGNVSVQDYILNSTFEASYGANNVSGRTTVDFTLTGTETLDGYSAYGIMAFRVGNYTVEIALNNTDAAGTLNRVEAVENAENVAEVNGVGYTTVAEALANANGGTVKMIASSTEAAIMVPAGVTLDLNGNTLTVGSAASFGIIMDSGNASAIGTGKLIVGEYDLAMSSNGVYAPVWDGTGYVFVAVEFRQQITTSNGYKVRFYNNNAVSRSYISQIMADGDVNNVISLVVRGSWTGNADGNVSVQDYILNSTFEASYGANNVSGRTTVDFTLTGTETLDGYSAYGIMAFRVGNFVVEITV